MENKFKSFLIDGDKYFYLAQKRDLLKLEYLRYYLVPGELTNY